MNLSIVDVSKSFRDKLVLDEVSLTIAERETFAIMGPNGSGKSTLASIIAGVMRPTKGEVFIDNKEVMPGLSGIGYLPQWSSVLFYLTAQENLSFYGRIYGLPGSFVRERGRELLKRIGLLERSRELVRYYSPGMRRKLEIMITLLADPQLLILDEPGYGVDPIFRRELIEIIEDLKGEDRTIIMTSHIADDVEAIADRVGFICSGRFIAQGTVNELKMRCESGAIKEVRGRKQRVFRQALRSYSIRGLVRETSLGYKIYPIFGFKDSDLKLLSKRGYEVDDVVTLPPTLEDAFILMAGQGTV